MAIGVLAFTSCDKVPKIENFGVKHTFEHELEMDVKDSDPDKYAVDFVIDVKSDKDFADNISKISGYTVKSLNYRIAEFKGDAATSATGVVQFYNETTPIGKPIDMGLISFQAMVNSGNSIEIPLSEELSVLIQDHLLNSHYIKVALFGAVSNKPLYAKTVVSLEIEALVKVD